MDTWTHGHVHTDTSTRTHGHMDTWTWVHTDTWTCVMCPHGDHEAWTLERMEIWRHRELDARRHGHNIKTLTHGGWHTETWTHRDLDRRRFEYRETTPRRLTLGDVDTRSRQQARTGAWIWKPRETAVTATEKTCKRSCMSLTRRQDLTLLFNAFLIRWIVFQG